MHRLRVRKPSPAMLVAICALVAALGGTSYAAFSLPKNSVGSKQLKKNAVTNSKIKNGAVTSSKINVSGLTVPNATNATNASNATNATTAGNANKLGGVAPSGYQGKTRWALIQGSTGNILAQSGGITNQRGFAGGYYVNFGSSVASSPIIATLNYPSNGFIDAAPCGGGSSPGGAVCVVSGTNDTNHVFVGTYNTAGTFTDENFYVAVEAP